MSNLIIQNEMDSTLDLTAINDVDGNPVSLWPRGDRRASREITEAASQHESVQRVRDAKWVKLIPLATAGQPPIVAPTPAPMTASSEQVVARDPPADPAPPVEPAIPESSEPVEVPAPADPVPSVEPAAPATAVTETRAARRARGA